jgi:hypothetical protein
MPYRTDPFIDSPNVTAGRGLGESYCQAREPHPVRSADVNVGRKSFKTGHSVQKRALTNRPYLCAKRSLMGYFKLWQQQQRGSSGT